MLERLVKTIVVPMVIITILMGLVTLSFSAASQINDAVTELSSAVDYCVAEINVVD